MPGRYMDREIVYSELVPLLQRIDALQDTVNEQRQRIDALQDTVNEQRQRIDALTMDNATPVASGGDNAGAGVYK